MKILKWLLAWLSITYLISGARILAILISKVCIFALIAFLIWQKVPLKFNISCCICLMLSWLQILWLEHEKYLNIFKFDPTRTMQHAATYYNRVAKRLPALKCCVRLAGPLLKTFLKNKFHEILTFIDLLVYFSAVDWCVLQCFNPVYRFAFELTS